MPNSPGTSGTVARQETLQAKKLRRTINALFSRLRGTRTTIPRQGSATSVEADYTVRRGGGDRCRQVGKNKASFQDILAEISYQRRSGMMESVQCAI